MSAAAVPQIGFGLVIHQRLKPARHAFRYGNYFCLLPMRALARQPAPLLHRNRWGWLSFHDADHGDGGPDALAWLDGVLRAHGVWHDDLAQGEVWLQTYPRVLGYVFKPVSFWYVHRPDGELHAVVAEGRPHAVADQQESFAHAQFANDGCYWLPMSPDQTNAQTEQSLVDTEALIAAMLTDDGVRLPGAKRDAQSARAGADGLEIPDAVLEKIKALATP